MGTTPSTPQLSQEQADIKYLGSRFPFGDPELVKLYRVFNRLQEKKERTTFLTDLAVECVVGNEAEKQDRRAVMQVVERKILPQGFSDQFAKTNFLGSGGDCSLTTVSDERMVRLESFFEGASNVGRRGGRHAIEVLFKYYSTRSKSSAESNKQVASCNQIIMLAYRLSLAAAFMGAEKDGEDMSCWVPPDTIDDSAIRGMGQSLIEFVQRKRIRESPWGTVEHDPDLEQGLVEKLDLQEFAESNLPVLSSALSTFMFHVFFPEKAFPRERSAFNYPILLDNSVFFQSRTSPLLFNFASLSPSLGGSWHRLYTSAADGLSFNRLQNALLGYGGPTLLIIQAGNGGIFGAFTASAWKESKDFYGNSDCFLYQLLPSTTVCRPSGGGTNYMYCNSEARSRGYDKQAHGIGFGGDVHQPRLFISESFEDCVARSQDFTFEYGLLLPKTSDGAMQKHFDIDSLEVWGVGGGEVVAEALGARSKSRAITEANLQKARKVDKAAFLDDFRAGIIESKAFAYKDQIRGRADASVDERNQNAYVYEK